MARRLPSTWPFRCPFVLASGTVSLLASNLPEVCFRERLAVPAYNALDHSFSFDQRASGSRTRLSCLTEPCLPHAPQRVHPCSVFGELTTLPRGSERCDSIRGEFVDGISTCPRGKRADCTDSR